MASGGRAVIGPEWVAASAAMRRIAGEVERAAALSSTVLLLGETGVGKGLVARTLHGRSPRRLGARVVAATQRDLASDVRAGRFRADLFYRLDVIRIAIPPLRERREDVPPLCAALLARIATRHGAVAPRLSADAVAALARH